MYDFGAITYNTYVNEIRLRFSEPDPNGRWPTTSLLPLINRARQQVMLDFQWPQGTWYATVGNGIQEYSLGDLNNVLRAYLVYAPNTPPQPLVYEDIGALEGDQIGLYDQTAKGYAPQWMSQAPAAYPVASSTGYPVPVGVPWSPNASQRPKWYLRGGHIGILPAPSNVCLLQLDVIPEAPKLVLQSDHDILPQKAIDAVVWKVGVYMMQAQGDPSAMKAYEMEYGGANGLGGALGKLISWRGDFPERASRAPLFVTYRTRFQGPPRLGSGKGRVGR